MGKSNKKNQTSTALPHTPLLYINDPRLSNPNIDAISAVIPFTRIVKRTPSIKSAIATFNRDPTSKETVLIITDNLTDDQNNLKFNLANTCKTATLKRGSNFVSINLYLNSPTPPSKLKDWGTNHLDLNIAQLTPEQTADKVYKWLFKTLSIPETIHLISPAEMLAIDTKQFPNYSYCSIADAKLQPKDAKVQFVAVVTSKPVVCPTKTESETDKKAKTKSKRKDKAKDTVQNEKQQDNNDEDEDEGVTAAGGTGAKLTWSVADRTGTATFYFIHRSPVSQATWDWVLSLQLGARYALPRMPSVAVTEPASTRVFKAPIRLVGNGFVSTGAAFKVAGKVIGSVGDAIHGKLGKAKEWVPQAEYEAREKIESKTKNAVVGGGRRRWTWGRSGERTSSNATAAADAETEKAYNKKAPVKREIKVFDSKGKRLWDDDDNKSVTTSASVYGTYINEKEFV